MKRLLSKFSWKRARSVPEALQSIIGTDKLERILQLSSDRREYISLAADLCSLDEEQLAEQVSKRIGLPFTNDVPPMDLSRLPSEITLEHYEAAAIVFDTSGDEIQKVICCDPELMSQVMDGTGTLQCHMSTWSRIKKALKGSTTNTSIENRTENADDMAKKVLEYIVKSAMDKEAEKVYIDLGLANPNYYFHNNSSEKEFGQITPLIVEPIATFLSNCEESTVSLNKKSFLIEYDENNSDTVCLSLVKPSDSNREPEPALSDAPWILVIDDSESFSSILKNTLTQEGFNVHSVSNGESGLELLTELSALPALIVCDYQMPGMKGDDFIHAVREIEELASIPIIVMTSDSGVENEIQLISSGADAFIGKEKDLRLLIAQIKRLLNSNYVQEAA